MGSGSEAREISLYSRIVGDIREAAITAAEVAEITHVGERQVQHWAAGTHRPSGTTRDRLLELKYVIEQLRDVYTPEGVEIWIHGRNQSLSGAKPLELLKAGRFEEVLSVIGRLKSGAM